MMRVLGLVMIFLVASDGFGQAQLSPRLRRQLDSIATQDVPAKAPGIATAIIRNGEVIYQKLAGYADLTDSSLIDPKTRFNIASNGKQFTALAILTLVDAGKLKLTDDIRAYFPTLFHSIQDKISIRSLLNHTSGIRDCYDLWSLQGLTWWEKEFSNTDVLQLIEKQEELNFKPDTKYLYSNTNYILLALMVEKVTGQSFTNYTDELFRKLGMPNTSFEDNRRSIRGKIARSYFNFGEWTTYPWIWKACGDGNIFSTLEDQVQWEKLLQGSGKTLLKRELILRSQQPIAGSPFPAYGYGLEFGRYKGLDYTFHEGATGAWKATTIRFPGKGLSLITLTNTGKSIPSMQTRQMADLMLNLKRDADYLVTKPARVGAFVSDDDMLGTYLTENDFAFQFIRKDGKIFLRRSGRNDVELEREADNILHQKFDPPFKQEFTRDAKGRMQVTAYYTEHAPYSLTKQNGDFSGFKPEQLDGRFINSETGTILNIHHKSAQEFDIQFSGNDSTTGLVVTPGKMLVDNYSLRFADDIQPVDTILLNGERIRNVRFRRL